MFDRKKYEGKRALRRWPKWLPAAAAVALIATLAVGGTLAWLSAYTQPVKNTFVMGTVPPQVTENFENHQVKEDVAVTNTGNIPAYIRVALVFTWQEGEGENAKVVGTPVDPAEDLNIVWGDGTGTGTAEAPGNGWIKIGDYYYYTQPVAAGATTSNLIDKAEVKTANGYRMNLQVIADSIQANPTSVVQSQWGVMVDENGAITGSTNN